MSRPIQYCTFPDCNKRRVGRGLCLKHYMRWKRHGDPGATPRFCSLQERFWKYVTKTSRCWIWNGSKTRGYGNFVIKQRPTKCVRAHRYAYELLVAQIPNGMTIDHLCKNPSCVNPSHMEIVTFSENSKRGNPMQSRCGRGHKMDKANTYYYPKSSSRHGRRKCRKCGAILMRRKRSHAKLTPLC